MNDIYKYDMRWKDFTYIETLTAMCDYYGTFSGRWHSNTFWAKTKNEIENMDEDQAKQKVFEIENDADGSLCHYQRQYN